jgi:hypothetical protein
MCLVHSTASWDTSGSMTSILTTSSPDPPILGTPHASLSVLTQSHHHSSGADSFQIYFDFDGHVGDPKIDKLISEIRKKSQ